MEMGGEKFLIDTSDVSFVIWNLYLLPLWSH